VSRRAVTRRTRLEEDAAIAASYRGVGEEARDDQARSGRR
jgi:hypothetical protein